MPPRLSRTERDRLKEAVRYQDIGKGLGPRLAKVLAGGVDGLLDQMETLVGRYAKEIGDSPANASRWLSSVWGPYDRDWLYKVAGSLPEPLAGKWAAAVAAMRRDRQVSRRKAIAYASRMTAEMIEQRATEVAGPPLGKVAEEASARTAFQVSKAAGVGFSFSLPNQAQIERVMKSAGVSKQIKGFSQAAVKAVEDEVVSGMMAGESIEDIARRIRKNSDVETMVRARRIARTMSTDCAAEAKLMEYQEIGVEEYEIRCVYDERTCATCGAMDKKRFPVAGAHPRPSFHPNCRCLVVQVLPPELADRLTRSARDEDGKTIQVPQSMTFEEWRDRYAKGTAASGKVKAVQNRPSPAPRPRRVYQVANATRTPSPTPTPTPTPTPSPTLRTTKRATKRTTQTTLKTDPVTIEPPPTPTPTVEPPAPVTVPTPTPPQKTEAETKAEERERMMRPDKAAGVEKAEPMDFGKADGRSVNPDFARNRAYQVNCQTCTCAYEMRRRGYNVEAKGWSDNNEAQVRLRRRVWSAWHDPETGEDAKREFYGGGVASKFTTWLDDTIGEGERYQLYVAWKRGSAHIMSAERDAEGVFVYDPQCGAIYRGERIKEFFGPLVKFKGSYPPYLMRMDNLAPDMDIMDEVLKEARK